MDTKELVKQAKPEPEFKTTALDIFNDGTRCYIMHFRAMNRPPLSKVFMHAGDLMGEGGAIERAKAHCEKMHYRFCGCYPHIVDLDKQERLRNDELGIGEY
jgi:hypothetical protein